MSAKLSARERCSNHIDREAVARCPECRRFLCRECATEHQGRIICSGCMAKGFASRKARGRSIPLWPGRLMVAVFSFFAAWFFFYLAGYYLVSVPSTFHKESIWRSDSSILPTAEEEE